MVECIKKEGLTFGCEQSMTEQKKRGLAGRVYKLTPKGEKYFGVWSKHLEEIEKELSAPPQYPKNRRMTEDELREYAKKQLEAKTQ